MQTQGGRYYFFLKGFYELGGVWVTPWGWKDLAGMKKERRAPQDRPRTWAIGKKETNKMVSEKKVFVHIEWTPVGNVGWGQT